MFKGWEASRWDTPVSNLKSIAMVSLIDDGSLTITLEDLRDPKRKQWSFFFKSAPVYFNLMEEFRGEMWGEINKTGEKLGWTVMYPNSTWHKMLKESDDMLETLRPNLEHYQIATEDDVIDILSENAPIIKELKHASKDDPSPGKSSIYYRDEDSEAVEELFNKIADAQTNKKTPNK